MEDLSSVKFKDEIGHLFRSGEVFLSSDQKLDDILKFFADDRKWGDNQVPALSPLTATRVAIINTIKQQRHIDKIENRNQIYTRIIIGLTVVSILSNLRGLIDSISWIWNCLI